MPLRAPVGKRFASNTTADAQKKAQDVMSGAQKNAQKFLEFAKKYSGSVGDRLGGVLGSYRQPLMYNLSVGRELLKQVYIAERLQPPTSLSTITDAYSTLWARAKNPTYWRDIAQSGEWARVGVYAVEAYTIFKVGEILGRRSLVGYNLE